MMYKFQEKQTHNSKTNQKLLNPLKPSYCRRLNPEVSTENKSNKVFPGKCYNSSKNTTFTVPTV